MDLSAAGTYPEQLGYLNRIEDFLRIALSIVQDEHFASTSTAGQKFVPDYLAWIAVVGCVAQGCDIQNSIWQLSNAADVWNLAAFHAGDQHLYAAFEHDLLPTPAEIFLLISQLTRHGDNHIATQSLAAFASHVVALDHLSLEAMAKLSPATPMQGSIHAVFDMRSQQWQHINISANTSSYQQPLMDIQYGDLPHSSLAIADLETFGFARFDQLSLQQHFWLARLRPTIPYEIVHVFYQQGKTFDGLVWLGTHTTDRSAYLARLVKIQVNNYQHVYVSNVLSPIIFPIQQIMQVYARRLDVAMAVAQLKQHLHLDIVWSAYPSVLICQLWAALTISQIILKLQMEVADQAHIDPFEISIERMAQHITEAARSGKDIVPVLSRGDDMRYPHPPRRMQTILPVIDPRELHMLPQNLSFVRQGRYKRHTGSRIGFEVIDYDPASHPCTAMVADLTTNSQIL